MGERVDNSKYFRDRDVDSGTVEKPTRKHLPEHSSASRALAAEWMMER